MIELHYMVAKTFETWFQTRSEADLITSKPKRRNLFHLHLAYARARLTTCNTNSSLKNVSQNHWLEKQPKPQASFSSYSNWECFFFFFFFSLTSPSSNPLYPKVHTHKKNRYVWTTTVTALFLMFCTYALYIWCSYCFAPVSCSDGLKSHLCIHKHAHSQNTLKKTFCIFIKKILFYLTEDIQRFMPHLACTHT